jgi:hypothetical protein
VTSVVFLKGGKKQGDAGTDVSPSSVSLSSSYFITIEEQSTSWNTGFTGLLVHLSAENG